MNTSAGFLFACTVVVVCIQWTRVDASLPSGLVDNSPTNDTKDCACNPIGSLNTSCDNATGVCNCRTGYEGANCTVCQDGYYHHSNRSAECISCQCNKTGSLSKQCNRDGSCPCKPGFGGIHCDQCLTGYYGLSTSGCQQCSCEETAIKCPNSSKSTDPTVASMCHSCLLNASWASQCRTFVCRPSEYLLPNGSCTACQCSQSPVSSNGSRLCDLMTGQCPECKGEACQKADRDHFQYRVYIIVSGAVAGVIVILLIIFLTVYCRRRWRQKARRTPLPVWTIELRRDEDEDDLNTTQELAFDDLDVMYLDDSYLMESSSDYFTESNDSVNGRNGYHTLS